MYDWPEAREATDAWAAGLARHLEGLGVSGIERELVRAIDHRAAWARPDLVLSQTCGYPLTHGFAKTLRLVATPHYRCDGCDGPHYRSIVFARARSSIRVPGDLADARAAFNTRDSMSGMLALKLVFAPHAGRRRFFAGTIETGSHVGSLLALAREEADVCAVDCVTVCYARCYRNSLLDGLVEIARSPAVPALPYVTSASTSDHDVALLRMAIRAAAADEGLREARSALFIDGFSELTEADYAVIPHLERTIPATANVELW